MRSRFPPAPPWSIMKSLLRPSSLAFAALILTAGLPVRAQAPAPLGSTVCDWDALVPQPTPVGMIRRLFDGPAETLERLEMHVTTLNPGHDSHPPHHHPQEELILIKEGTVEFSINGRQEKVGAGSLVFAASHDRHNLSNFSDRPATYYVINFYTAATATVRDQAASTWAPAGLLRSGVIDWAKLAPAPTDTGVRRQLIDSPTLTFARLEIHATTLDAHRLATAASRHPWPALLIVKEGVIAADIGGVSHLVGPGAIIYLAPNTWHSIGNPGAVPSTYYVFFVSSAATPPS